MATGNGAYVIHRMLESRDVGYRVVPYHPNLTLFPFLLKWVCNQYTKADLTHTTADYGVFLSQRMTPMVITFHNYVLDPWMWGYSSFLEKIHYATDLKLWTRLAVGRANRITSVSQFTAVLVKKDLPTHKDITVIYNGVDEKKFIPIQTPRRHDAKLRIFYSGNLTLRKGSYWLPQIAKKISPNTEIHYTQGLRKKGFVDPGQNLKPIGAVPFEKMPERYQGMDVLLMPTVREGFGLAVAEAMACGLPVVASNCSSIPELIDNNKGGFLCPVGDVEAFGEKINILADSPRLRKEMGEYNRAKVENMFTLDRMVKEYKMLFEEVLDKKRE